MLRSLLFPLAVVAVLLVPFAGCGVKHKEGAKTRSISEMKTESISGDMPTKVSAGYSDNADGQNITLQQPVFESTKQPVPSPAVQPVERKIIYTAHLRIIVDDLDEAQKKLDALLEQHKAYVAASDISGHSGTRREGTWTIRVPVDQFKPLRAALLDYGYPEQNSLSSEDVTNQYFDTELRIEVAKATEARLKAHLDKSANKDETLGYERELHRVIEQIEVMKGQLRYWSRMSAMTTVYLTLVEEKDYKPPQAPSFGENVSSTFSGSVETLQEFGKGFVLFVVAVTPWLPLIALMVLPIWISVRRSRRQRAAGASTGGS